MNVVGYVILISLVAGLAFLFVVNQPKRKKVIKKSTGHLSNAQIADKWRNIEATFSLGGPSNFKSAIMDADKLIDSVLSSLHVPGNSLGERLKRSKSKFNNYNDYNNLWFAHKVRNNIAHEVHHELNSAEAKRAMEYFRKALKELGVI